MNLEPVPVCLSNLVLIMKRPCFNQVFWICPPCPISLPLASNLGFIKQLEAVTIGRSRESIKSWLQDCMHDAIEDNLGCHIILHKKQAAQTWSTVRPLSGIACFLQERISGQVTTASDKDLAWILRHCPSLSYRKVTDRVMNSGPFTCLRAFKYLSLSSPLCFFTIIFP